MGGIKRTDRGIFDEIYVTYKGGVYVKCGYAKVICHYGNMQLSLKRRSYHNE